MTTKMVIKKKGQNYSSKDITTLRFPDNVRSSPAMFLGSVDAEGVWLTVRELLDNALDEYLAGRNTVVALHCSADGSYWVIDQGHGVPQGMKKFSVNVNGKDIATRMPTMQAVFGELHTSGKYRSDAYATSVGTHGIGAKGTNATALFFTVYTCYEGKWYTIGFKQGKLTIPVTPCRAPKGPTGKVLSKGTMVHFKPDPGIFSVSKFPLMLAHDWAEIMSYLNPGFSIHLSSELKNKTVSKKHYLSQKGPAEYITNRVIKQKAESEKILFEYKSDLADVVVAFSNYDGCDIRGFTNGLNNSQGGKHVDAVTGALYAGLKPYIKTKKVEGKPVPVFRESDLKEGLIGLVNAKLHKAEFSSQDKARLTDARMGAVFEQALTVAASKFFKDNKALAQRLSDRAAKLNELKNKFAMSKRAVAALNAVKRNGLPAKYAPFDSKSRLGDRELFLVEGDSAGGSTKEARFPYQAVLPLKGKIMNVEKDAKGKAMDSSRENEIINIFAAIGYDPKAADPLSKLTVGKIICLADPDPDGPFVGDTKIRFRLLEGAEEVGPIESMVSLRAFEVPVWHGNKEIWAPATASLVKNVEELVALEIGKTKVRVDRSHRFQCLLTKAVRGRDVDEVHDNEKLVWVRAEDLKVGDRVYHPMSNNSRDPATMDKESRLGFQAVSKMRIQNLSEPIPVYCLTVPKYHSFILPSGIVSANCHINSLLLTLFYKYLPELFSKGMVYVSAAPEFYALHKGQLVTGDTLSMVQKKLKGVNGTSATIVHIKGWGGINPNLMRIMACDPQTRRLIKIKAIEKEDKVEFIKLMNDDVAYRRDMLGLPSNAVGEEEEIKPARKVVKKTTVTKLAPLAKGKRGPVSEEQVEEGQRKLEQAKTHVRRILNRIKKAAMKGI